MLTILACKSVGLEHQRLPLLVCGRPVSDPCEFRDRTEASKQSCVVRVITKPGHCGNECCKSRSRPTGARWWPPVWTQLRRAPRFNIWRIFQTRVRRIWVRSTRRFQLRFRCRTSLRCRCGGSSLNLRTRERQDDHDAKSYGIQKSELTMHDPHYDPCVRAVRLIFVATHANANVAVPSPAGELKRFAAGGAPSRFTPDFPCMKIYPPFRFAPLVPRPLAFPCTIRRHVALC